MVDMPADVVKVITVAMGGRRGPLPPSLWLASSNTAAKETSGSQVLIAPLICTRDRAIRPPAMRSGSREASPPLPRSPPPPPPPVSRG